MTGLIENRCVVGIVELFSSVFRLYQKHLGLFWRVMMPLILISLLCDIMMLNGFYHNFPNTSWVVSTSEGFSVTTAYESIQNWRFTFTFSSFILFFLWFTMCPLVLTTFQFCRDMNVSVQSVWQRTLRRIGSIFGASFLLLVLFLCIAICFLLLSLLFVLPTNSFPLFFVMGLVFIFTVSYFMVRWSLFNQGIIIENLSALQAFRRSSELVRGRWWGFFIRYLLLVWVSTVFLSVLFALSLILLSTVEPEFVPIRESLLSGRFFHLFFGIDAWINYNSVKINFGNIKMALWGTPSFWTIGVILVIKTLIHAFFTPIWAILTTHLYLEQTGGRFDSGRISENAMRV